MFNPFADDTENERDPFGRVMPKSESVHANEKMAKCKEHKKCHFRSKIKTE